MQDANWSWEEKRGDHKKDCIHIVQGGLSLKTGQNRVQNKNNFYKNSQPQIWYFEINILKNIHARCKLIRKTKRWDHKKHFKHIIQGGSRLKTGQNRVQK